LEKRGFGGRAPNKLRPVLKARGVSLQATHTVGMAKSLSKSKALNNKSPNYREKLKTPLWPQMLKH